MSKLRNTVFVLITLAAFTLAANVENIFAKGRPHSKKAKVVKRQDSGSMEWVGRVDDRVRIEVRRRNAKATAMSGQSYNDGDSFFSGRLPNRNVRVQVDKLDGRGRVYVVQQPSRRNNYTAVVDIVDNKGGADRYRIRLTW